MTLRKSAAEEISLSIFDFINKNASAKDDFKSELAQAKTKSDVDAIYNKYRRALQMEPTQEDWEVICNLKKAQLPAADDGMAADDKNQRSLKSGLIYRNLNTLCSMADDFDINGFEKFAELIDGIIKKISTEALKND